MIALVVLLALTAFSYAIGRSGPGTAGNLLILSIAAVKAGLVLMVFMHLTEQRFGAKAAVAITVLFVILLASLTAGDVATRETFPPAPREFESTSATELPGG